VLVIWPVATRGQSTPSQGIITLTGEAEERIRLSQLAGTSGTGGFLIRSASRLTTIAETRGAAASVITGALGVA
jgi:hypothetical protein